MHPNDGRVVSNFIIQALQNLPITIYGSGDQTRSFCYVDDLIELMVRFMSADDTFTGPMNMGNPGEFTIKELAELIIEMTNSKSDLSFIDLPQDDPKQRKPEISLAQNEMGWAPKVTLEEGLVKTIDYFDRLLQKREEK
jgi:UDP-glucuronate decarboxylase